MRLGPDDLLRRAVIGRLLCHCILHKREIEEEFNLTFDDYFAGELDRLRQLQEDGLVTLSAETIEVTPLGRIFLRNIGMVFDRYLREPKDRPVYSRTL
jgi:oxygen-independent coproporphyrinogen-3 oxidase